MTSIRLTFPISNGRAVTLEGGTPQELTKVYAALGGDASSLVAEIRDAAADPELHAPVVARLSAEPVVEQVQQAKQEVQEVDPWGAEGSADPDEDDPWGSPDPTTQSAPSASSNQQASGGTSGVSKTSDRFGREFTFNLPNAPRCEHGQPAAKMKAKSQKTNSIYHQWVCAKTAGEDWKKKCDFKEFTK